MSTPPIRTVTATVVAIEDLAPDIARVFLHLDEPVSRLAGQYLEIVDGNDAYAFSIASPPESGNDIELHVRHGADNPSSLRVVALLRGGVRVTMRLPQGDCVLRDEPALPLLFIAGSTGFSQVKAFVEHAIARGWTVPVTVCWGARRPADLYLHALPRQWEREHANIRYVPVLSGDDVVDGMRRGLVPDVALEAVDDFAQVLVYACGSPPMVYAVFDAFTARGVPASRILSDVFAWAPRPGAAP